MRYELAHYLTFIQCGPTVHAHGAEFRIFCQRLRREKEVYKSTICLTEGQNQPLQQESSIVCKVKKLLALSTSSNTHEAEQATIKSQQLLLKHNIDVNFIDGEDGEKIFHKRIMEEKKETAKTRAIGKTLETFFVNNVYS